MDYRAMACLAALAVLSGCGTSALADAEDVVDKLNRDAKLLEHKVEGVVWYPDLVHSVPSEGWELHVNLHLPADAEGPVPVVLWYHGGAFRYGSYEAGPSDRGFGAKMKALLVGHRTRFIGLVVAVAEQPAQSLGDPRLPRAGRRERCRGRQMAAPHALADEMMREDPW